jgi:hypothetical protein
MANTTTITKANVHKTPKSVSFTPPVRSSGAIYAWFLIGIGAIWLFLQDCYYWVQSPQFVAADPGPDPYHYMHILRGTEFLSCAVFLYLGNYTVAQPWLRSGVPSLDGKLFLAGVSASTLDIFFAAFNPTWAMNAHAVAFGTWAHFIPGFPAPGANEVPWGLLWCLPAYIWLGVGAALLGCAILDWLRGRFETLNTTACYATVYGIFIVIFGCMATFWNRYQVYTYVSLPRGLTLWYGETYQLPMYEPMLVSLYCMGYVWARDTRDGKGRCVIDRDVDLLPLPGFGKEVVSTIAICGYAAAVTFLGYMMPFSWLSMTGDSHPELPSYLQSGLYCGQPGGPLCPGQLLKEMRRNL